LPQGRSYESIVSFSFPYEPTFGKNSLTKTSTDAAISQYAQIASVRQPKEKERSILQEWIGSASMGGGCGFLGRDLGGFEQLSVYEAAYQKDLAILSDSYGEDDLFTKFITGPLLTFYHLLCGRSRVSQISFPSITTKLHCMPRLTENLRPLFLSTQRIHQLVKIAAVCTTTTIVM
jgi:hypothetical protein